MLCWIMLEGIECGNLKPQLIEVGSVKLLDFTM